MPDETPTTLLRIAAFFVDSLLLCLLLIIPSTIISYAVAWLGGSTRAISSVWWVTLVIVAAGMVLRDGYRGRSPGKRLFGLTLRTPSGRCGFGRSIVRNLPLLIPGINLIEAALVLFNRSSRRTGDYLARTMVVEE
jgi:uncharacterized RDD family membrane protein YckC